MQADLKKNYFDLFDLPISFEIDSEALSVRYRDMQRAVHPDRFANASDQERMQSVQQAAHINEALQTLKSSLLRARYLLQLRGVDLDDTDTRMDPAFLMEQMELREKLEAVKSNDDPFAALAKLRDSIEGRERDLIDLLRRDFAEGDDSSLQRARESVRKMQFLNRILEEVNRLEEDLVHEI